MSSRASHFSSLVFRFPSGKMRYLDSFQTLYHTVLGSPRLPVPVLLSIAHAGIQNSCRLPSWHLPSCTMSVVNSKPSGRGELLISLASRFASVWDAATAVPNTASLWRQSERRRNMVQGRLVLENKLKYRRIAVSPVCLNSRQELPALSSSCCSPKQTL